MATEFAMAPERPHFRFWPVASLLVVGSLLYRLPLFSQWDRWGRQDWDQFTYRYATARTALLRDHVLPTWNPYSSGGTVLWAHPDSPVPSPWFAIVMLLGAPVGLRVQVAVFMAIGAVGMGAFVRRLGAGPWGWVASGIVFMMSSHFALHVTEGHLEWCVLGMMPWLAWCALRLHEGSHFIFLAALLLASVLTFGAVHIPAIFLPFLSVWLLFESVRRQQIRFYARWAAVVLVALLLSSAKLIPTIAFASANPRQVEAGSRTPLRMLPVIFADPRQVSYYQAVRDRDLEDGHFAKAIKRERGAPFVASMERADLEWRFHEYGCYIGVAGLILATAGLFASMRRHWPLYAAGFLAGVVALGASSPIDLWAALQRLPLYDQFRVPSRFLGAVLFVLAVAAAFGPVGLAKAMPASWVRVRTHVVIVLVVLLYGELTAMGWRLFGDIFVVPPVTITSVTGGAFVQRFGPSQGPYFYPEVMTSNMYSCLLSNSGSLDAYENLTLPAGDVTTFGDSQYRGEAYLEEGRGHVTMADWRMSRVVVNVAATASDVIVLNQNYADGWKVRRWTRDGQIDKLPAVPNERGLISAPVDQRHASVEFSYLPTSVVIGGWISISSLAACVAALLFLRPAARLNAGVPRT